MAGPFTETFTADNSTPVSSLTGWAKASAATSPIVSSNQVKGDAATNASIAYYNTAVAESHYAKLTFKQDAGGGTGAVGPAVRCQSNANSCYYCLREDSDDKTYNGEIVAGSATDWDSGQSGIGVNDIMELLIDVATPTKIYFRKNGTVVSTYTSKTALWGGFAGVCGWNNAENRGDDWVGGDSGSGFVYRYPGGLTATDFNDGLTSTADQPENYCVGSKINIPVSGTVTTLGVMAQANSGGPTLKVALFNSSGTLLGSGTVVIDSASVKWRQVAISPVTVTAGDHYVMVSCSNSDGLYGYDNSGNGLIETVGYASFPPSTLGSLTEDLTSKRIGVRLYLAEAGWRQQKQSAAPSGSSTGSVAVTYDSAVLSGNTLVAFVCWSTGTDEALSSFSDSVNGAWTAGPSVHDSTNAEKLALYYFKNSAAGTPTVTATFVANRGWNGLWIAELSGMDTTTQPDVAGTGQVQAGPGTSTDAISSGATSGTATLDAYCIGVSIDSSDASTISAGTGKMAGLGWDGNSLPSKVEAWFEGAPGSTATATFTDATNGGSHRYLTAVLPFKLSQGTVTYQYAYPTTDTTRDNWEEDDGTTTAIYDQIDEVTADDADYIRTQLAPSSDVYVTKLTTLTDPVSSTGYQVSLRYGKESTGGDTISLVVQLRQGYTNESSQGTLIATALNNSNISSGWTRVDYDLSGTEANSITNHGDLYLRFVGNQETVGYSATPPSHGNTSAISTAGATSTTITASTQSEGDLLLIAVESSDSTTAAGTPNTPSNWSKIFEDTEGSGATGVTTLTIFARLAPAGGTGNVTVDGVGDHIAGSMMTITGHGVTNVATDIVVGAAGKHGTGTTGLTTPGITVAANSLIVWAIGLSDDAADTTNASGYTNSNLASITERRDNTHTTGAGGGIALATATCSGTTTGSGTWNHDTAVQSLSVYLGIPPPKAPRRAQVSWARFRVPEATGPVTHTTSGTLTTQAATAAGTAQHKARHTTTGTLTSQAATAAGTAQHRVPHPTTGALTAQAATAAGTAARTRAHATAGTLTAQAATAAGTAARTRAHATTGTLLAVAAVIVGVASSATPRPSTGTLTAQSATLAGTAARVGGAVTHTTTGALTAQSATLAGTAARTRAHATTGALTAQSATLAGTAQHRVLHATTGTLTAQSATLAGTAARTRAHATTGALTAQSAALAGEAARFTGAVTHPTTGALSAQAATVAGTASSATTRTATGALVAQAATVSGTASSATTRTSTGALVAQAASITGSVTRFRAHPTTAALTSQSAALAGTAARTRAHLTTGVLTAQAATAAGTAQHRVPHPTTGALTAQAATAAGTAQHRVPHPTTGALTAQAATAAGTAQHRVPHPTTGALTAQAATAAGTASRVTSEVLRLTWTQFDVPSVADADKLSLTWTQLSVPPAEYNIWTSAGVLVAQPAVISGTASSSTPRSSTGALTARAASVAGAVRLYRTYTAAGMLIAQSAQTSGAARRYHAFRATGALAGQNAQAAGAGLSYTSHLTTGNLQAAPASVTGHGLVVTFHPTTGALAGQPAQVDAVALRLYQGLFNESPYHFETPVEPVDVEPPVGLRETLIPAESRRLFIPIEGVVETPRLMLVMPEQRKLTVAIQADRPAETP